MLSSARSRLFAVIRKVFCKCHHTLCLHRSHGEGQFFHVAGHTEETVAQDRGICTTDDTGEEHQSQCRQPCFLNKGTGQFTHVGRRIPFGELIQQTERCGCFASHHELAEDQVDITAGDYRTCHVEQDEDLRLFQGGIGAFCQFDEQDHRHPLSCSTDTHTGDQLHVNSTGDHDNCNKDCPEECRKCKAVIEVRWHFHQVLIFL